MPLAYYIGQDGNMNTIGKLNNHGGVEIPAFEITGFRQLSLWFFVLLLPLCACSADTPGESVKTRTKGTAENTAIEEKKPLGRNGAIFPVMEADEKHCLSFSKGRNINRVEEFLSFFRLEDDVTYRHKQTGELIYVDIFSASYDLNDDGKDEYFYYFESAPYCGMQLGCPINVYEYNDGRFRELFDYKIGIITNNYFDPLKEEDSDYLCIDSEKDFGWKKINQKKLPFTYFYNGTYYTGRAVSK